MAFVIDITLTEDMIDDCKEEPSIFGLVYDVLNRLREALSYETGFWTEDVGDLASRMLPRHRDLLLPLLYEEEDVAEQRLRLLCPLDISIETDEREY